MKLFTEEQIVAENERRKQMRIAEQELSTSFRKSILAHLKGEKPLEVAPEADAFDMLDEADLASLSDSMVKHRVMMAPLVFDRKGRLIDGRNRLKALTMVDRVVSRVDATTDNYHYILDFKRDPRDADPKGVFVEFKVKVIEADPETVTDAVLAGNIHRRHLNASQKAAIVAKLTPAMDVGTRTKRAGAKSGAARSGSKSNNSSNDEMFKSDDQRAKEAGVSQATITRARRDHKLDPEITDAVIAGDKQKADELREAAKAKAEPKAKPATNTKAPAKPKPAAKAKPKVNQPKIDNASVKLIVDGLNQIAADQKAIATVFETAWNLLEAANRDRLLDRLEAERTEQEKPAAEQEKAA